MLVLAPSGTENNCWIESDPNDPIQCVKLIDSDKMTYIEFDTCICTGAGTVTDTDYDSEKHWKSESDTLYLINKLSLDL